jgi:hypothetical protein
MSVVGRSLTTALTATARNWAFLVLVRRED